MEGAHDWSYCPSCCLVEPMGLYWQEHWREGALDVAVLPTPESGQDCHHPKHPLRLGQLWHGQFQQAP
jgi:hypothetical protein